MVTKIISQFKFKVNIFYVNTLKNLVFYKESVSLKKSYKQVKKKLESAENFIFNAESLLDIANYPPFHFEHLKGDRKDEWSIRLGNTGYRVTMIPCDNDGKEITEGDILARCKTIKIVKVTEVSNHYE